MCKMIAESIFAQDSNSSVNAYFWLFCHETISVH